MDVLVVGGTGTAGRPLVRELLRRGHTVRVLSRHAEGVEPGAVHVAADLTTGEGLAEAVAGVEAVVDVSNIATLEGARARAFFVGATQRLVAAGAAAGVRRHVLLSIVGVDRMPTGYYRAKVAQEQALAADAEAAGVAWVVLRATQFHDFAGQLLAQGRRGPLVVVPGLAVQPVSTDDVAAALADAAEGGPAGRLPVLAGPEVMRLPDMVRALLQRRGERGLVLPLPVPGRTRALLPAAGEPARSAGGTYADWLSRQGPARTWA